ncbi:MAG: hypothetical protein ACI4ND_09005 [Succinivibrio sp.]
MDISFKNKSFQALFGFAVAFIAIVFFAYLAFSGGSTPQDQFKNTLKQIVGSEKNLDKMTAEFRGLSGKKKALMKEHYQKLFDDEMIDYMILALDKQGLFNEESKKNKGALIGKAVAVFNQTSLKGISRLSAKERFAYFVFNQKLSESLAPRACKMYVAGDPRLFASKEFKSGTIKALSKMSDSEYESYLSAMREAFRAEIKNAPARTEMTDEQSKLASEYLSNAMDAEFAKLPAVKRNRLLNASEDLDKSNPADACSYGRLIYRAASSISDEQARDLVVRVLLSAESN